MMKNILTIAILFVILAFIFVSPLAASDTDETATSAKIPDPVGMPDPAGFLGMDIKTALAFFGTPDGVLTHRGDLPGHDDVVFQYNAKGLSVFWFENHIWVIRYDSTHKEPFYGISISMKKDQVLQTLAFPHQDAQDSVIFFLKDRGFPVRLRLYFVNDQLTDAYLYRGDF